jgi:GntR family transcriptional regulator of gluconate operon
MAKAMAPVRQVGLGQQVAADLRLRIVGHALPAGTHLAEGNLAEEYDVSRGPVREALRELQVEGLVSSQKGRTFVVGLTTDDVEELMSLRESIESLAATKAMDTASEEDWASLESHIDQMKAAADRRSAEDFAVADMGFHTGIYTISGHRRVRHVWSLYEKTFTAILQLSNELPEDLVAAVASHEHLLAVMRAGNKNVARQAIAEHLHGTRELFMASVAARGPLGSGPGLQVV